jgi:hypothetical protein
MNKNNYAWCEFCDDFVGNLFTKTITHINDCLYDFSGRIVTKTALDFEKNQVHYLVITAQAHCSNTCHNFSG